MLDVTLYPYPLGEDQRRANIAAFDDFAVEKPYTTYRPDFARSLAFVAFDPFEFEDFSLTSARDEVELMNSLDGVVLVSRWSKRAAGGPLRPGGHNRTMTDLSRCIETAFMNFYMQWERGGGAFAVLGDHGVLRVEVECIRGERVTQVKMTATTPDGVEVVSKETNRTTNDTSRHISNWIVGRIYDHLVIRV